MTTKTKRKKSESPWVGRYAAITPDETPVIVQLVRTESDGWCSRHSADDINDQHATIVMLFRRGPSGTFEPSGGLCPYKSGEKMKPVTINGGERIFLDSGGHRWTESRLRWERLTKETWRKIVSLPGRV